MKFSFDFKTKELILPLPNKVNYNIDYTIPFSLLFLLVKLITYLIFNLSVMLIIYFSFFLSGEFLKCLNEGFKVTRYGLYVKIFKYLMINFIPLIYID